MNPIETNLAQDPVRVLIVFDSWEGHTAVVARHIGAGITSVPSTVVDLCPVGEATRERLCAADALIMGSPVHQRTMSWPVKRFVDLAPR